MLQTVARECPKKREKRQNTPIREQAEGQEIEDDWN
jgi:hypothetical protein